MMPEILNEDLYDDCNTKRGVRSDNYCELIEC